MAKTRIKIGSRGIEEIFDWQIGQRDEGMYIDQIIQDAIWDDERGDYAYLEKMDPDPWETGDAEFNLVVEPGCFVLYLDIEGGCL